MWGERAEGYIGKVVTLKAGNILIGDMTGQRKELSEDLEIRIQGRADIPQVYFFFANNWRCLISEDLLESLLIARACKRLLP